MRIRANLKTRLAITILLVATGGDISTGAVVYVNADAVVSGDGTSWANPYKYLQDALRVAMTGDEIRVAEGVYKPDEDTLNPTGTGDRSATFQLKNGVAIKGGYAGFGEPNPDDRNIDSYETILSGDLDENDAEVTNPADLRTDPTRSDNSRHVATGNGTDATALLDGLTITAGYASPGWPDSGGGMYNRGYGSPTISDCTFTRNFAEESGGGMYNRDHSNPTLTNCVFSENWTDDRGGGIHSDQDSCVSLTGCYFIGNSAGYGGGMQNQNDSNAALVDCIFSHNSAVGGGGGGLSDSSSSSIVTDCSFSENNAHYGGGVNCGYATLLTRCTFNMNTATGSGGGVGSGRGAAMLTNCIFTENSAENGGGMNIRDNTTLNNCTFSSNTASNCGGGLRTGYETVSTLVNCTFILNSATEGGGVHNDGMRSQPIGGNLTLIDCKLDENVADRGAGLFNHIYSTLKLEDSVVMRNVASQHGGGIYNDGTVTLEECTFTENSATEDGGGIHNAFQTSASFTRCDLTKNEANRGGAIYNNTTSPDLLNCTLRDNYARNSGGAIYTLIANPTMTGCTFIANTSKNAGGALYNHDSSPIMTNCSFSANSSNEGGGVYSYRHSTASLINCILWGDTPDEISGIAPDIIYSDVQGGWIGTGNINADPLFADIDLRLSSDSPCIDMGDNSAVLVATDLDGNPRIVNDRVDMGAYEAPLLDPAELLLNLMQDVMDMNLQHGIENALVAKLEAALQLLEDVNGNNDVAAINSLEAFINLVEAQKGKKISDTDADALIADAQQIINLSESR